MVSHVLPSEKEVIHGGHVEISGRENSKELLRPESVAKFLAFGQARWDDPLKDQEDQTIWLVIWEMSDICIQACFGIDYQSGRQYIPSAAWLPSGKRKQGLRTPNP